MKKLLFATSIVAISFVLFNTACKKSIIPQEDVKLKKHRTLDYFDFDTCMQTNAQLTDYESRCDEEAIYAARFTLAYAMKADLSRDSVVDFIYNTCSSSTANESMKLSVLFSAFPNIEANINAVLSSPISGLYYQFNDYDEILAALTLRGIDYEPGITIPNLSMDEIDDKYPPVWSGGTEILVDDRTATVNKADGDYLFCWNIRNGDKIKVNETQSAKCHEPIMSICLFPIGEIPYSDDEFTRTYEEEESLLTKDKKHTRANHFVSSNQLKINHRYDGSKWSEIYKTACRVTHNIDVSSWEYHGMSPNSQYKESAPYACSFVYHMYKLQIGTTQTDVWDFSWNKLWQYDDEIFYNLFERDWWESRKAIGNTMSDSDVPMYLWGRMGHSDEWYLVDPNDPALQVQPYNMITYDYGDQIVNHLPVWLMTDASSKCSIGQWICYP